MLQLILFDTIIKIQVLSSEISFYNVITIGNCKFMLSVAEILWTKIQLFNHSHLIILCLTISYSTIPVATDTFSEPISPKTGIRTFTSHISR